ncbi:hypothetical protein N7493_006903 [Penicillium malachiteum]|uniref:Uncharacterized protein n=1 Tax=Penicillium malachiteum TaxID=1324776 RepID=A0AAD6MV03_9EURO|nr:hypothetical protein N7493_006903 [Penicillium malachiteum]
MTPTPRPSATPQGSPPDRASLLAHLIPIPNPHAYALERTDTVYMGDVGLVLLPSVARLIMTPMGIGL